MQISALFILSQMQFANIANDSPHLMKNLNNKLRKLCMIDAFIHHENFIFLMICCTSIWFVQNKKLIKIIGVWVAIAEW